MTTFKDYQAVAANVPASLRNNRDRFLFPISGLQHEAGKLGALFTRAATSNSPAPSPDQIREAKDSLADMLWCMTLLCGEAGITLQEVAEHSATLLATRMRSLNPDGR